MIRWGAPGRFMVQCRFRRGDDWTPWTDFMDRRGRNKDGAYGNGRARLETHSAGCMVQARIQPAGVGATEWEIAEPARIIRAACVFWFTSPADVTVPMRPIAAVVRHAVCAYRPKEEIRLRAGVPFEAEMQAVQSSPFNELDAAGEFAAVLINGTVVRNRAPSTPAMIPAPEDFSFIRAVTPDGPFCIA